MNYNDLKEQLPLIEMVALITENDYSIIEDNDIMRVQLCPICGGGHNTPHFTLYDRDHYVSYACGKNPGASQDIFNLAAEVYPKHRPADVIKKLIESKNQLFGDMKIEVPELPDYVARPSFSSHIDYWNFQLAERAAQLRLTFEQREIFPVDNRLLKRGISMEIAYDFKLHIDNYNNLLVPFNFRGKTYGVEVRGSDNRKLSLKGSTKIPFNLNAIDSKEDVVFVVEGWPCALSILQEGYQAIAVNGAAYKRLIQTLPNDKKYIFLIDNDHTQKQAYLNINKLCVDSSIIGNIYSTTDVKDFNDFYCADKAAAVTWLADLKKQADTIDVEVYKQAYAKHKRTQLGF